MFHELEFTAGSKDGTLWCVRIITLETMLQPRSVLTISARTVINTSTAIGHSPHSLSSGFSHWIRSSTHTNHTRHPGFRLRSGRNGQNLQSKRLSRERRHTRNASCVHRTNKGANRLLDNILLKNREASVLITF